MARIALSLTSKQRRYSHCRQGDVAKAADVRRLLPKPKSFDTLDVLVNNAGVYNSNRWKRSPR